jgi:hypothetical protein
MADPAYTILPVYWDSVRRALAEFPGMRSDRRALPASRLVGGLKVSFARNALTRPSLAPNMVAPGVDPPT